MVRLIGENHWRYTKNQSWIMNNVPRVVMKVSTERKKEEKLRKSFFSWISPWWFWSVFFLKRIVWLHYLCVKILTLPPERSAMSRATMPEAMHFSSKNDSYQIMHDYSSIGPWISFQLSGQTLWNIISLAKSSSHCLQCKQYLWNIRYD